MKKLICMFLLVLSGLMFVSCSDNGPANVTIKDAEGNESTLTINPTKDKAQMMDIFDKLESVEVTTELPKGISIEGNINFKCVMEVSLMGEIVNTDVEMNGKAESKVDLEALQVYASMSLQGKTTASFRGESQTENMSFGASLYTDDDYAYLSLSEQGESSTEKTKYDLTEIRAQLDELMALLENAGITGITSTDSSFEMPSIEEMIDHYYLEISATTSSSFTLSAKIPASIFDESFGTNDFAAISVKINTKTMLPEEVSVDLGNLLTSIMDMTGEFQDFATLKESICTLSLKLKYEKVTVPTLTDTQKAQYSESY